MFIWIAQKMTNTWKDIIVKTSTSWNRWQHKQQQKFMINMQKYSWLLFLAPVNGRKIKMYVILELTEQTFLILFVIFSFSWKDWKFVEFIGCCYITTTFITIRVRFAKFHIVWWRVKSNKLNFWVDDIYQQILCYI